MRPGRGLQLGNSPEPIRTTTASGSLLGSLKEGGESLYAARFLYEQKREKKGGSQFLAQKNPKILNSALFIIIGRGESH